MSMDMKINNAFNINKYDLINNEKTFLFAENSVFDKPSQSQSIGKYTGDNRILSITLGNKRFNSFLYLTQPINIKGSSELTISLSLKDGMCSRNGCNIGLLLSSKKPELSLVCSGRSTFSSVKSLISTATSNSSNYIYIGRNGGTSSANLQQPLQIQINKSQVFFPAGVKGFCQPELNGSSIAEGTYYLSVVINSDKIEGTSIQPWTSDISISLAYNDNQLFEKTRTIEINIPSQVTVGDTWAGITAKNILLNPPPEKTSVKDKMTVDSYSRTSESTAFFFDKISGLYEGNIFLSPWKMTSAVDKISSEDSIGFLAKTQIKAKQWNWAPSQQELEANTGENFYQFTFNSHLNTEVINKYAILDYTWNGTNNTAINKLSQPLWLIQPENHSAETVQLVINNITFLKDKNENNIDYDNQFFTGNSDINNRTYKIKFLSSSEPGTPITNWTFIDTNSVLPLAPVNRIFAYNILTRLFNRDENPSKDIIFEVSYTRYDLATKENIESNIFSNILELEHKEGHDFESFTITNIQCKTADNKIKLDSNQLPITYTVVWPSGLNVEALQNYFVPRQNIVSLPAMGEITENTGIWKTISQYNAYFNDIREKINEILKALSIPQDRQMM